MLVVENAPARGALVPRILTRNIDQEDQAREALRNAGATDIQIPASRKA